MADAEADAPASLTIDRADEWRARDMVGVMLQGTGASAVVAAVGSGQKSLRALATEVGGEAADAVVRLRPRRVVWWQGWTSGSRRSP